MIGSATQIGDEHEFVRYPGRQKDFMDWFEIKIEIGGHAPNSRENRYLKFQHISYYWRKRGQEHDEGCFNYSKVFWGADLRGDGFNEASTLANPFSYL
jgi:hypothetical protein